jgi:hypothetical protein
LNQGLTGKIIIPIFERILLKLEEIDEKDDFDELS